MNAFYRLPFIVFALLALACGKSKETATQAGPNVATSAPAAAAPKADRPVPSPPRATHASPGQQVAAVPPAAPGTSRARSRTPARAEPLDFAGLYRALDKPVQSFTLPAGKDTLLTCREGTTLQIPAGAFVSANTGEPVTGPVAFRVKEYYSVGDALLANLSTMTKSEPLESGGMVHLEAVADGEVCALKAGASVRIGFPYQEKKEGMQLFNGRWENGTMQWEAAAQPAPDVPGAPEGPAEETVFQVVEQMPEFKGGMEKLLEYINQNLRYPLEAAQRGAQGTVFVGFVVGRNGEIENARVLKGIDPVLDAEALRVINGMPRWNPGRQSGKTARVRYSLPIRFIIGNEIRLTSDTLSQTDVVRSNSNTRETEVDFEPSTDALESGKVDAYELSQYLFSTTRLGWINCDRFYLNSGHRKDYYVNIGQAAEVDVKVVFDSRNVILVGTPQYAYKDRYYLGRIPVGQKITIFALKRENGAYYLAVQKTQVKDQKGPELAFQPVTVKKLKAEIAKLGRR